eukprot:3620436-Rhodomonas_salina.1
MIGVVPGNLGISTALQAAEDSKWATPGRCGPSPFGDRRISLDRSVKLGYPGTRVQLLQASGCDTEQVQNYRLSYCRSSAHLFRLHVEEGFELKHIRSQFLQNGVVTHTFSGSNFGDFFVLLVFPSFEDTEDRPVSPKLPDIAGGTLQFCKTNLFRCMSGPRKSAQAIP